MGRPYDIVATCPDAGIIEAIPDTVSLDALKKVSSLRAAYDNVLYVCVSMVYMEIVRGVLRGIRQCFWDKPSRLCVLVERFYILLCLCDPHPFVAAGVKKSRRKRGMRRNWSATVL